LILYFERSHGVRLHITSATHLYNLNDTTRDLISSDDTQFWTRSESQSHFSVVTFQHY